MLETYEWSNLWWEHADDEQATRILLIGDSITRAYLPHVNRLLDTKAFADAYVSSRALDNPDFFCELGYMLGHHSPRYAVIHFNNGLHGWHMGIEAYQEQYKKALLLILERAPSAKIVLATSTPVYQMPSFELDVEKNAILSDRNSSVHRIATQFGIDVDDLSSIMVGQKQFYCPDGIHFLAQGEVYQAQSVCNSISPHLDCLKT